MKLIGYILLFLSVISCTPNDDNYGIRPVNDNDIPEETGEQLLAVMHEGNFMWGNASVSLIDLDSGVTYNGVYNAANNELLGDVGQSIYVSGDTGWIVVNNSGKIEMVDLPSFKRLKQITGFVSPRYIDCDGEFCYVTDIYGNQISVLNKTTGDLIKTIPLAGWSEELRAINNKLFVNYLDSVKTSSTTKLILVNQVTGRVEDTLFNRVGSIDLTAESAFVIQNNSLFRVNYESEKQGLISDQLPNNCTHLSVSVQSNSAYFISNQFLYKLNWLNSQTPERIASLISYTVYNLEVNTKGDFVFLVDAANYTSSGRIVQFSSNGKVYNEFEVGVLPNDLHFL